ncbi:MAG: hypothetical protein ACKOGJ_09985 [Phycisphaerales bacterium]
MAGSAAPPTVDLAALAPDALLDALLPAPARAALVARVLAEDLGDAGDVTSEAMIDAQARARAVLRPRTAGIACGMRLAAEVLAQAAPGAHCSAHVRDAERVDRGAAMLSVEGPLRGILAAERTMLNFVGRMSGIATRTAEFVPAGSATIARNCSRSSHSTSTKASACRARARRAASATRAAIAAGARPAT